MLRPRALSAAVLVPSLLLALVIGRWAILGVVTLAVVLAAREMFGLLRSAGYPSLAWLGTVLAALLVVDAGLETVKEGSGLLLLGVGVALIAIGAFARPDPRDGLVAWTTTVFGALYVALLAFVVRLGLIAPDLPVGAPFAALTAERGWVLLLVLGVWAYDTGAYLVGDRYGTVRFLTHISASKTYAGLVGGLAATTIVSGVMLYGLGQPPVMAVILGPILGLAAQAGDLAESMIKRAAGAKESGGLIPGHGGVLDRTDSFLFAAPAVTLFVVAFIR
jgi:phosphatidate cytidylyltransferase